MLRIALIMFSFLLLNLLPVFKVRRIEVYYGGKLKVKGVLKELLGKNALTLKEEKILNFLNENFNNAFESLNLERKLSLKGVFLRIKLKERRPAFKICKNTCYFIDKSGEIFENKFLKTGQILTIYSQNFDEIKQNFDKFYKVFYNLKGKVFVKDSYLVYRLGERQFLLPSPEKLKRAHRGLIFRFLKAKAKTVDLRFGDLIILR